MIPSIVLRLVLVGGVLVSAAGDASTTLRNTNTRELDVSSTTTTSAVLVGATTTPLSHRQVPAEPSFAQADWVQYYESLESGKAVDPIAQNYMNWLMGPVSHGPDFEAGIFGVNPDGGKNGTPSILPGSCEYRLNRLTDRVKSTEDFSRARQAEYQKAFDDREKKVSEINKKNKEVAVKQKQIEMRLAIREDYDKVVEDELWLLRSYIRCCPVNYGRLAVLARSEDENEDGYDLEDDQTDSTVDDDPTGEPEEEQPSEPDESTDDYEPSLGKPQREGLLSSGSGNETNPWAPFPATADCESKTEYYKEWVVYYLYEAQRAGSWITDNRGAPLPKLEEISSLADPSAAAVVSQEDWRKAIDTRNRIVKGYTRCCQDRAAPGPLPTGTNHFPSVRRTNRFGHPDP